MRIIALIACLFALAVDAAPLTITANVGAKTQRHALGNRIHGSSHPTNSFDVLGVEMPPKWTEEDWIKRQEMIAEFHKGLDKLDEANNERWRESLTEAQRQALKDQSASNEVAMASAYAKRQQRQWELEGVTNRMAWVKKEWHEKRRSEYEYHPGLKWMGSEIVKETVTRAESGKVELHFFYTADGNKHRFDPETIKRDLDRKRNDELLKEIVQ